MRTPVNFEPITVKSDLQAHISFNLCNLTGSLVVTRIIAFFPLARPLSIDNYHGNHKYHVAWPRSFLQREEMNSFSEFR